LRAGFAPQVGDRPSRLRSQLSWKDLLDQGYVIGGSPATVRERLEYAIKELHTGHLMVLCQFGSMPPELARQNTELFAKKWRHTCAHSTASGKTAGGLSRCSRRCRLAVHRGSKTRSSSPSPQGEGVSCSLAQSTRVARLC
jgi:hypothetical protein